MPTSKKLVLNRETLRRLGAAAGSERATGSVDDSCWRTLCTTESGCEQTGAAGK
ncbi:MAG TPA: hypothetical protein VF263_18665 [Longimicrobiaceae bacterium]